MTPGARLQAAIEVLTILEGDRAPADQVLKAWGREHRFAGSADRRAIAERVYSILRARARLAFAMESEAPRHLVLAALHHLDGLSIPEITALSAGEHGLAPPTPDEIARLEAPARPAPDWVRAGVPPFIAEAFATRFGEAWMEEAAALIQPRAPVDLRVNGLRGGVDGALKLLALEQVRPERTPWSAFGLRLPAAAATEVQKTRPYKSGWIEVQDEASQIAAFLAGAQPGETVIDYCAGAGGKTLVFAQALKGQGHLVACDVHPKRMAALQERLDRAGAEADALHIGPQGEGLEHLVGRADLVFVDAPCSGSGTWRRHPEGAWRTRASQIGRFADLQLEILRRAARLVKVGGRLAYATCSVLAEENDLVADAFAASAPNFAPLTIAEAAETPYLTPAGRRKVAELAHGARLQLTPRRSGTDGFFLALYHRRN